MKHLYLVVEGQTEQAFVHDVLAPHLGARGVFAHARLLGRPGHKGGRVKYSRASRDIDLLLKQFARRHNVVVSTMFDWYALGRDFPGFEDASARALAVDRVRAAEKALTEAVGDPRFFAYLQLHEFEALLLSKPAVLGLNYGDPSAAEALAADIGDTPPEDVDQGRTTSPSHRIIRYFPRYARDKTTVGPRCVATIGLETLRSTCPHFGAWLTRLEALGQG